MYQFVLLSLLLAGQCIAEDDHPPSIVVRPPPETVATETKNVQFTCAAYGVPLPTVKWTKGKRELTQESIDGSSGLRIHTQNLTLGLTTFVISVLELDGVNSTAGGEFGCWAENGIIDINDTALSESSAKFSLVIDMGDSEPAIIVDRPLNQTVDHSSTVEAVCVAYGNPLPTVSWSKVVSCDDGREGECERDLMGPDTVYYAVAKYGDSAVSKSVLQLCNVSRENDAGIYRCTAWNVGLEDDQIFSNSSDWSLTVGLAREVPVEAELTVCKTDNSRVYQIATAIMAAVIVILLVVIAIITCYLTKRALNEYKIKSKTTKDYPESAFSYPTTSEAAHIVTSFNPVGLPHFNRPITMRKHAPTLPDSKGPVIRNPIFDPENKFNYYRDIATEKEETDTENDDNESSESSESDDDDHDDKEADSYTFN